MRVSHLLGPMTALLAGMALSACATREPGAPPLRPDVFAIERGREIAEFHCASCHQTGPSGASPSMMAPPLHSIYISYSRLSFRKAVESSRDEPAHAMPGYDLNRDQVDDLLAYLDSNRPAAPSR